MKIFIFSVLLVVVAINATRVRRETCTTNQDCEAKNHTVCPSTTHVICQHPANSDGIKPDGGLCTCSDPSGDCPGGSKEECFGNNAPNLQCADDARHCYDGRCICDRFPIPGK